MQKLRAIYEGGVLRPIEPLRLDEHQLVSVIILDDLANDELAFEPPERFESLADHSVSLEAVRQTLAKIPGSLDADFAAERDDR